MLMQAIDTRSRVGRAGPAGPGASKPYSGRRSRRGGGGLNLHSYVRADPVNNVDPTGLTGECINGDCGEVVVTARRPRMFARLHSGGGGGVASAGGGRGGVATNVGNALDRFAEKHLKPPQPRQDDETYEECKARVSGAEGKAVAGASGVIAGSRLVNYPRATPGGGGTSIISTLTRNIFGNLPRMGSTKILGTNSIGGAIGRALSRFSVIGGAASIGFSIGEESGASKICQK